MRGLVFFVSNAAMEFGMEPDVSRYEMQGDHVNGSCTMSKKAFLAIHRILQFVCTSKL